MRLNSARASRVLRFIYLLCLFIIIFDVIVLNIDGSWGGLTKLSPFAILVILVLIYRGFHNLSTTVMGKYSILQHVNQVLLSLVADLLSILSFPKETGSI